MPGTCTKHVWHLSLLTKNTVCLPGAFPAVPAGDFHHPLRHVDFTACTYGSCLLQLYRHVWQTFPKIAWLAAALPAVPAGRQNHRALWRDSAAGLRPRVCPPGGAHRHRAPRPGPGEHGPQVWQLWITLCRKSWTLTIPPLGDPRSHALLLLHRFAGRQCLQHVQDWTSAPKVGYNEFILTCYQLRALRLCLSFQSPCLCLDSPWPRNMVITGTLPGCLPPYWPCHGLRLMWNRLMQQF